MSRQDWQSFLRRSRARGAADTVRAALLRRRLLRCLTPRKVANLLAVKIQKRLHTERVRGRPYRYKLDPINVCALRCPLCPSGRGVLNRPATRMDPGAYRGIVDQVAPHAVFLDLFGWGEPLRHPDVYGMIRYAADRGLFTRLSSTLCDPDWEDAESLVRSGLEVLILAFDGVTQDAYGRYRQGARLEAMLANVRGLVAARGALGSVTPHITARMLVHRGNEHEVEQVRTLAYELGLDAFTIGMVALNPHDPEQATAWLPENPAYDAYRGERENHGACDDLWESLVINADGGVVPCCWMYDPADELGNLVSTPLAELWNGAGFRAARRAVAGRPAMVDAPGVVCHACGGRPDYLAERAG